MLSTDTRTPFTFGCRLLAAITLTFTTTACDSVDEDTDESALLADDADNTDDADDADEADAAPAVTFNAREPGDVKDPADLPADLPEGPDGPDQLQAAQPDETAAQTMYNYSWYQGNGDVEMRSIAEHFCFLTRVSGNLDGGGEMVRVYPNGTHWYLGGISAKTGVSANATCIPLNYWGTRLAVTGEYSWHQSYANSTYMGNGANQVCFLTRVTGKFMGGGERVQAWRTGAGDWMLGGSSGQVGVAAGARCVQGTPYGVVGPVDWGSGQGSVGLGSANDWACGLTRVQGKFAGGGEAVHTFVSNDYWYLGGINNGTGVWGSAACL